MWNIESLILLIAYLKSNLLHPWIILIFPNISAKVRNAHDWLSFCAFLFFWVAYCLLFLPSLLLMLLCRSRVQQSSTVYFLHSSPCHGQRSEVTGAVQSQPRWRAAFPPHQPAAQRCLQRSHWRRRRGSQEGLLLSCIHLFSIFILQSHHRMLKIAANLDYLSWIALLRDWGLVFSDKSAQRCRLNKATQVTANTSCYQADESLLTASSHVFAEVPNRPGLLHRQGAADHRADIREGPGGGDCGKTSQAVSPTCRLFSLAPSSREKHRLFQLAAPPKHSVGHWQRDIMADEFSFLFIHFLHHRNVFCICLAQGSEY